MKKHPEEKAPSALNTAAAVEAAAPPTVGRTVIYSHPGGPDAADNPRLCAAVVTGVDDEGGGVSLFIMHPDGAISSKHHVKHGTEFGTWHWPPRV
jgi:hypothetical protein